MYYTIIALGILIILCWGVYAVAGVSHDASELPAETDPVYSASSVADGVDWLEISNRPSLDTIPPGVITMWSGSIASIPSGWALCYGSSGTPDLRDRFVVGAGASYGVGSTGGNAAVNLTIAQMPSHMHSFTVGGGGNSGDIAQVGNSNAPQGTAYSDYTSNGGQPHENRPPYYALAYICKL